MELDTLTRADQYWATTEDPDELAGYIKKRIERFWDQKRRTGLYSRVQRSWRYYHNLFYDNGEGLSEREIRELGERGEYAGIALNHTRNLLQHLLTLATQNPPAFDAISLNTDARSLRQSKFAVKLLEAYRYLANLAEVYTNAVENSLVCSEGFVKTVWNPNKLAFIKTPMGVKQLRVGDLEWSVPEYTDVVYDWRVKQWDKQQWVIVRTWENKWELAEQFTDKRDEIVTYKPDSECRFDLVSLDDDALDEEDDYIPVDTFYHLPTEVVPFGVEMMTIGGTGLHDPLPLPYRELPIDRVVPARTIGTAFGYTPAFDLQGLQEAINGEMSSILTNHKSFGVQSIWTPGDDITISELKGGLRHVSCSQKPEALNLTETPPELFQFVQVIEREMETLSGINSVTRGQPEASLKSGRALALIAAQSVQFANTLVQNVNRLLEHNGTRTIRIMRDFMDQPRVIALAGKHQRSYIREFTQDDLSHIDRIKVQAGNAMMRTLAGRVEMADKLMDSGFIRNREEYLTVVETGQLDAMLEAEEAQINVVREENERLLDGGIHIATAIDYHILHIREHHAQLNTTEVRMDPMLSTAILAACMEHIQLLMSPMVQYMQQALGFPTAVPPVPGAPTPDQAGQEPGMVGRPAGPEKAMDAPPGAPQLEAAPAMQQEQSFQSAGAM